ncbi:MAG: MBOAT family protein [Alphaproteobacteria bacterium]|nr:MBOAT family protein [Alphaproteobacteria bacterium]
MIFTSFDFLVFLSVVLPSYWLVRNHVVRKVLLIAASLFFYAYWDIRFVPLLVLVATIVWFAARAPSGLPLSRTQIGILAISAMLIILGVFKYADFFVDNLNLFLGSLGLDPRSLPRPGIILPVGISFFTFQGISYLIDVRRGQVKAHGFVDVLLYIALFPQLVAGPIVRAADFFPQLASARAFNPQQMAEGCRLFLLGLIYKAVLADNIARLIDPVWEKVSESSNSDLVAASVGFYAQIYFDFNGYSLMAIGVAAMFGYIIPENFNYPYIAVSLSDFWRRWHISLSLWLRDYLYIPLGGGRGSRSLVYRNLMITMTLGGLWHGASWNFLIWGGLHGVALSLERMWLGGVRRAGGAVSSSLGGLGLVAGWLWTQAVVFLLWVPFRAESTSDTFTVFSALFGQRESSAATLIPGWFILGLVGVLAADAVAGQFRKSQGAQWSLHNQLAVGLIVMVLLVLLPLFISLDVQPFIYFQF